MQPQRPDPTVDLLAGIPPEQVARALLELIESGRIIVSVEDGQVRVRLSDQQTCDEQ